MKAITALFVAVLALGIAVPAQSFPNYILDKDVLYAADSNYPSGLPHVTKFDGTGVVWTTNLTPYFAPDTYLSLTLDKGFVYVTGASITLASNIGFVGKLDATTGQILWITAIPGFGDINSSATVDKEVVYVAGSIAANASKAAALNATTGEVLRQTVPLPTAFISSPAVYKDTVVFVGGGGPGLPAMWYILDAATGDILGSHSF